MGLRFIKISFMRYLVVLLLFCAIPFSLVAQFDEVVDWTVTVESETSEDITLILEGTIQKGWYVYSQHLASLDGPIATELVFNEANELELEGETEESGSKVEGFDKVFAMDITKYKDSLTLTQKIKRPKGLDKLSGYITYMSCDDEKCLPPRDFEFEVVLN